MMIGGDPNNREDMFLAYLISSGVDIARKTKRPIDIVAAWQGILEGLKQWLPEPTGKRRREHGLNSWQVATIATEMNRPLGERRLPLAILLGAAGDLVRDHLDTRCEEAFGEIADNHDSPAFQSLLWLRGLLLAVLHDASGHGVTDGV